MELSVKGERGILLPEKEEEIAKELEKVELGDIGRKSELNLP